MRKRKQSAITAKPTDEDSTSANTEQDSESDIPSDYQFQGEENNREHNRVNKIASTSNTDLDRGIYWKPSIRRNPTKVPKTRKPSLQKRQSKVKKTLRKEPTKTSNVTHTRSGRLIKSVEKLKL